MPDTPVTAPSGGGNDTILWVAVGTAVVVAGGAALYLHSRSSSTTKTTPPVTCPTGYTLQNGTCVASTPITCPTGQTLVNGTCVATSTPPATCPTGQTMSGFGTCVPITCPTGYSVQGGVCKPNAAPTACPVMYDGYSQYPYYIANGYQYAPIVFAAGTDLAQASAILCGESGGSCDDWPGTIQHFNPQIGSGNLPGTTPVGGQVLLIPNQGSAPVIQAPSPAALCAISAAASWSDEGYATDSAAVLNMVPAGT